MKGKQAFNSLDVIYIELTSRCNMYCRHCGQGSPALDERAGAGVRKARKDLDSELVRGVLDEFHSLGGKKVILTGGEPLLHADIKNILAQTVGKGYNVKLSTNGVLINDPRLRFVLEEPHDIGFRLSLDGPSEIHDEIRGYVGAYNSAIEAMKKISEKGRQLVTRTTVMRRNAGHVGRMISDLERESRKGDIKIYALNIWPIRNIGRADAGEILTPEEYKTFLDRLVRETKGLETPFRIIVGPTFGMEKFFDGTPLQQNEIYKCDILNTSLHIDSEGDIHPCSFVRYPLGNIADMRLSDVFRSERAVNLRRLLLGRENHDCNSCGSYESCKGGCLAERFQELLKETKQPVKDVYCFRA